MQDQTANLHGLHSAIVDARAQADTLHMPFVAYLLDLALAASKQQKDED